MVRGSGQVLDETFDPHLDESEQIVRIIGKIVHNATRHRERGKTIEGPRQLP